MVGEVLPFGWPVGRGIGVMGGSFGLVGGPGARAGSSRGGLEEKFLRVNLFRIRLPDAVSINSRKRKLTATQGSTAIVASLNDRSSRLALRADRPQPYRGRGTLHIISFHRD